MTEGFLAPLKAHFRSGATVGLAMREVMLGRLEAAILAHESELLAALHTDLGKAPFEAYESEIGMTLAELRFAKKHLARWGAPKKCKTPLALFPARSTVVPEPYGVALILAPWNYPVQLTLVPLIAAIAAGCCAVVKPSAYAPNAARAVEAVLREAFPPEFVTVAQGGRAENTALLEEQFDAIFFTGSVAVGRAVMTAAAKFLTPVTLELGGKSPVIVAADADLDLAGKRIAWGKFLNAGQTCVAPDHVWVRTEQRGALVAAIEKYTRQFYGESPLESADFPKIVNEKHFERILGLMGRGTVAFGGACDRQTLKIAPTVLVDVTEDDPVMAEEIFGPILPILTYENLDALLERLQKNPHPLALYLFTREPETTRRVMQAVPSGGVCVGDVVLHLANPHLPFGGVGESGMGACHGKAGFDAFTHYRALVVRGKTDLPVRYPPFTEKKLGLLKKLM